MEGGSLINEELTYQRNMQRPYSINGLGGGIPDNNSGKIK